MDDIATAGAITFHVLATRGAFEFDITHNVSSLKGRKGFNQGGLALPIFQAVVDGN
jgi:hypothetical protein